MKIDVKNKTESVEISYFARLAEGGLEINRFNIEVLPNASQFASVAMIQGYLEKFCIPFGLTEVAQRQEKQIDPIVDLLKQRMVVYRKAAKIDLNTFSIPQMMEVCFRMTDVLKILSVCDVTPKKEVGMEGVSKLFKSLVEPKAQAEENKGSNQEEKNNGDGADVSKSQPKVSTEVDSRAKGIVSSDRQVQDEKHVGVVPEVNDEGKSESSESQKPRETLQRNDQPSESGENKTV